MKRHQWKAAFDSFPVGLSILEISQRMGCSYRLAAAWVKIFGYKYKNWHPYKWTEAKKKRQWKVDWSKVPWGCSNAQIARAYGVSREIVRKRRAMHAA